MIKEGILMYNDQGRYCIKDYYWTSGQPIKIFYDGEWIKGRIEYCHDLKDYYFINEKEGIRINYLSGVKARVID